MKDIIERIRKFNKERNWEQFHKGVHLAKALVIEASELLELYQWKDELDGKDGLKEELADVFLYAIMIADCYSLDIKDIINKKIDKNEKKYPIDKAFGKNDKYDIL